MKLHSRLLAALAAAAGLAAPARADLVAVPDADPANLLQVLLGTTTGLSNVTATVVGDPIAFARFDGGLAGVGLQSGVILSTGRAADVAGPNTVGNKSTDLAGTDDVRLNISFTADATAQNLFFQFVFGSEEFPEYGGSAFNDRFELTLNGANLAKLSDGQEVTVNNLAPSPTGPFHPDYVSNAGGLQTQLDAYTKPLTFTGPLLLGANTLTIRVADVGDSIYDSAVFIGGGSLGTAPPAPPGPPVLPAPPAAALGLVAVVGLLARRRMA